MNLSFTGVTQTFYHSLQWLLMPIDSSNGLSTPICHTCVLYTEWKRSKANSRHL